jgi:Trypsin-like peptidase domain
MLLAELEQCVEATVKNVERDRSLVLLEAREKLRGEVPRLNVSDTDPGTQVRAFGFPTGIDFATRRSTAKENSGIRLIPTITSGTVVRTITDAKNGQLIVHQVPVWDGAAGGPLVNNCSDVVGLNFPQPKQRVLAPSGVGKNTGQVEAPSRAFVPTATATVALGAKELRTFLEQNGLSMPVETRACMK